MEIFSEYGNIIDIVAKTNLKAKGQAFIVFDNVDSATQAITEINGFDLFEKPMALDYAKTKSDVTVLRERGDSELEAHKRRRLAEKGMCRFHLVYRIRTVDYTNSLTTQQNGNKHKKLLKPKRSSSVRVLRLALLLAQQRQREALA